MDAKSITNRVVTKMRKVTINGDFEITLPEHRAARPDWYKPHGWEKPRLKHMSKNISSEDVMYYVGAEEGEFAALCQMWGAKVVVFEPNPKVWSHFPLLWSANNLDLPMVCIPGFASDKINNLSRIYYNEWPPEVKDVIEEAHGFKELYLEGETYGQITIDSCVYDHGIKPPTAILLDVEGSEWRVLGGAEKVLKQYKPKIWLSGHPEFMLQQWDESLYNLRQWIKELGYVEIILDYQHEVHLFYERS
jgi:FkbM family methyltransferase